MRQESFQGGPFGSKTNFLKPLALRTQGRLFYTAEGPKRVKLVTAFQAPKLFAEGKLAELDAYAEWTRSVGANGWRVFFQHRFLSWPLIEPFIMPLDLVRPFIDYGASQGLYVEGTVLCDCQPFDPDGVPGFNQDYNYQYRRVVDVSYVANGADNYLEEYANEPSFNGADVDRLGREVQGRFSFPRATGWNPVTGHEPVFVVLDYVTSHPPRKPGWANEAGKTGEYVYRQTGRPDAEDEMMGAAELPRNGERDNNPDHFEDAGGGVGLSSAEGTFHCDSCIATMVPGPVQTECATRYFAAMDFFPEDAPLGEYTHDGLSNYGLVPGNVGEGVMRIHGNRAYVAVSEPGPGWTALTVNGWRIIKQGGRAGNLLWLER